MLLSIDEMLESKGLDRRVATGSRQRLRSEAAYSIEIEDDLEE